MLFFFNMKPTCRIMTRKDIYTYMLELFSTDVSLGVCLLSGFFHHIDWEIEMMTTDKL